MARKRKKEEQKMAQKVRLDLKWEDIFPGEIVDVAGCSVMIEPLGIKKIAEIIKKIQSISSTLSKLGVTYENFKDPEMFFSLAAILSTQAPDILSDATGIHTDDIGKLPIEYVVLLLSKVVEVNVKSKETLIKNCTRLASTMGDLMKPSSDK